MIGRKIDHNPANLSKILKIRLKVAKISKKRLKNAKIPQNRLELSEFTSAPIQIPLIAKTIATNKANTTSLLCRLANNAVVIGESMLKINQNYKRKL